MTLRLSTAPKPCFVAQLNHLCGVFHRRFTYSSCRGHHPKSCQRSNGDFDTTYFLSHATDVAAFQSIVVLISAIARRYG
jgi:hypothetical protein